MPWDRDRLDRELDALQAVFDTYLAQDGFDVAVELTVQTILQSPAFLYRIESAAPGGTSSGYDVASRLSYLLWATMPDPALFDAAAGGRLATIADVSTQVDRMLADPRATMRIAVHLDPERPDRAILQMRSPALTCANTSGACSASF